MYILTREKAKEGKKLWQVLFACCLFVKDNYLKVLVPSNIKTSTRTVRLLGKGVHDWGHDSKGVSLPSAHQPGLRSCFCDCGVTEGLLVWHVAHRCRTGAGDVCRCEEHELPERRAETRGVRNTVVRAAAEPLSLPPLNQLAACQLAALAVISTSKKRPKGRFFLCPFVSSAQVPRTVQASPIVRDTFVVLTTAAWAQLCPTIPLRVLAAECKLFMNGALDIKYSAETQHFIQQLCYVLYGSKQFINATLIWKLKTQTKPPKSPLLLWHVEAFHTWHFCHILMIDEFCL